jgi:hypothetical protein
MDSDQLMEVLNWLEYLHENGLTLQEVIDGIKDGSLTQPTGASQSI